MLLAKPVPRWSLLAGKYVGVLAFVAFQATVFVIGTWAMLGLRTGVWHMGYLLSIFLLLLHFSIFFSVSTLLAVSTRSTVACVFGSVVFWLLCWGMNYGHHAALAMPEIQQTLTGFSWLTEAAYWLMPKPADMGIILSDTLHTSGYFSGVTEFKTFLEQDAFCPGLSILSSFLFSFFLLIAAAWQFSTMDY